jgi:hypothetical protein
MSQLGQCHRGTTLHHALKALVMGKLPAHRYRFPHTAGLGKIRCQPGPEHDAVVPGRPAGNSERKRVTAGTPLAPGAAWQPEAGSTRTCEGQQTTAIGGE